MKYNANTYNILIAVMCFFSLTLPYCDFNKKQPDEVSIFYAPCFSGLINSVKNESETQLNIKIRYESGGSQILCRKVTELGRQCDIMMLADSKLFRELATPHCKWRIDFAGDEMVLGVGAKSKRTDEAEKNWVNVLLDKNIRLNRADENLAPTGYRTLLVWKLMENKGYPELTRKLVENSRKPVENVEILAALLKSGESDYAFLYKTTCIANDIRYIPLDKTINLGSRDIDYSSAKVSFKKLKSGAEEIITIAGSPITYGLSIPYNAPNTNSAIRFINLLLGDKKEALLSEGFVLFKPKFYGSKESFVKFSGLTDYSGEF